MEPAVNSPDYRTSALAQSIKEWRKSANCPLVLTIGHSPQTAKIAISADYRTRAPAIALVLQLQRPLIQRNQ